MASLLQVVPKAPPPLDPGFRPAYLGNRNFEAACARSGAAVPLAFALEAAAGAVTRFETLAFPEKHPLSAENLAYAERVVKFLLWSRGGWKLSVAGPKSVALHLARAYSARGSRSFDAKFMAGVYEKKAFVVRRLPLAALPRPKENSKAVGRHLDGCRIGFDAGGSDRKVAAVINGEEVFSAETVWNPKTEADPRYHIEGVNDSIRQAAAHLPRIDAIGVSSAGVYVDGRCMVASLFRKVPPRLFEKRIKDIYKNLSQAWGGVPVAVANDGDVTALAGAMSLGEHSVLGLAMGTSQAAGYVDKRGFITGWLNELAFAPVDYQDAAPQDKEWSKDRGTGALYFSQDAVLRLASGLGFPFKKDASPAEKLKAVQDEFRRRPGGLSKIYKTMGTYLAYGILQYARFYDIKHVLLLGRVCSGKGGPIMLETARAVMALEDPRSAKNIRLHLPDESTRRLGQAVVAASLPMVKP
ncbi:MAG TPA: ROK family protein [bacterium]|jgi:predicted NBD/HSP70 family sugar kinase|nr:ROK family protein [bacterium]